MFKATLITFIGFLSAAPFVLAARDTVPSVSPEAAPAKLKEGNARFSSSKVSEGKPVVAESEETAKAQQPFAVILACADSRTAPAIIFDEVIRREHRNAYARARQMRVEEWIDEMVPMSDAVIGEEMSVVTATRNAIDIRK